MAVKPRINVQTLKSIHQSVGNQAMRMAQNRDECQTPDASQPVRRWQTACESSNYPHSVTNVYLYSVFDAMR